MRRLALALLLPSLALPVAAAADHHEASAAPARTSKDAYFFIFDDAAQKLTALAEAIPADKYGWRPAEGVRSIGEAFQHAAASTYLLLGMAGVAAPEGAPKGFEEMLALEKKSSKGEVAKSLADALAFARKAADEVSSEQAAAAVDFFGSKVDGRTLFLVVAAHLHEHLGQEIAYARSIGVVPPWSRPAPQEEKPKSNY